MKKVGFLLGSLSGAGAEKTILTLASRLHMSGCEVHLIFLHKKSDYEIPVGLFVHYLKDLSSNLESGFKKISEEVGELDLFVTSRAEFYGKIEAKKQFCSVHITPTEWLKKRSKLFHWKTYLQKLKLKKKFANKNLIALSQGIKQDLVNNLDVSDERVLVINNPFEVDSIREKASEPLSPDFNFEPYIVYVAALIPRKRHKDLLQAFSQLKNKDVKLVLVGKGPLKASLKRLVIRLGIGSRVVFWPWDSNPYRLIKHAELSVLVSEAEGMPRVLIESIIIGTPVISTDCPSGPNEILRGENSKYLVSVGDVFSIQAVMEKVLEQKERQDFDIQNFDAKFVAERYLDLIND